MKIVKSERKKKSKFGLIELGRTKFKKRNNDNANVGQRTSQGLVFNTALGQHILKNPLVVKAMVEKAGLKSTDTVLEIGPGTGNLTSQLLPEVRRVIACEVDPRMIAELHKRFLNTQHFSKLEINIGDVLKSSLPSFDVCVANLPYQISSRFLFKLLQHKPLFRSAIVMVQKEFADRMVAKPGDKLYSHLSANVHLLAKVDILMAVGKNNFSPPPKVESTVVRITPRGQIPGLPYNEWDGLLRIIFVRKNKTLGSIFKQKLVVKALEENYRIWCVSHGKPIEITNFGNKLIDILSSENVLQKRAKDLCENTLLGLLLKFNLNHIHFDSTRLKF